GGVRPAAAAELAPALNPMVGAEPLVQAMVTVPVAVALAAAFATTGSYEKVIPAVEIVQFAITLPVTVKVEVAVAARAPRESDATTSRATASARQAQVCNAGPLVCTSGLPPRAYGQRIGRRGIASSFRLSK